MAEVASDYVSILPSMKGFGSKLQGDLGPELDKAGKSGGKRFGDVFARSYAGPLKAIGAAAVGVFAGAKIAGFLKDSIAEARESQKVGALTAQVIKSTGGAAKVTAAQVGDLATAISNKTGIDDEAVQSASNLLLTFKNLRNEVGKGNDVFNQATQIATDMGAALGTEPKAAAIQLGKALNDPTKGIAALSRVGVTFNKQQTEQIKKMQKSGNILGAQKVILKELKSEFGGAAAASATAGEKFSTTYANFKEAIGTALLPLLDKILGKSTQFVTYLMGNVGPAFSAVGKFLTPAIDTVKLFIGTLTGKGADVGDLPWMNAVIDAGARVSTFVQGLRQTISGAFTAIGPVLMSVGSAIVANVLPVLSQLGAFFTGTLLPAVSSVVSYIVANVVPIFVRIGQIIATQVIPIIGSLAGFFIGTLLPAIVAIYTKVAGSLKPVFDQLVATFQARVLPALQLILAKFREWLPAIEAVISVVVLVVGKVLEFAAAILGRVLPVLIRFAGFLIGTVVSAVVAVIGVVIKIIAKMVAFGGAVVDAVKKVIQFEKTVVEKVGGALDFIKDIPGKIKGFFSSAGTLLINAGKEIIGGLLKGLTQKFEDVKSFVGGVGSWISDHKGPISYDRKLLVPHGEALMGGLNEGLITGFGTVMKTTKAVAKKIADTLATQLKAAQDKLKSLIDTRNQFASQTASSMLDFGSITGTESGDNSPLTSTSIVAQMSNRLTQVKSFAADLAKLRKQGLNDTTYAQLVQAGAEQGDALAQALLGGGVSAVKDVNSITKSLDAAAKALGQSTSRSLYQAGVDAAQALVNGLKSRQKAADAALASLTRPKGVKVPAVKGSLDSASKSERAQAVAMVRLHPDDIRAIASQVGGSVAGGIVDPSRRVQGAARNRPAS